MSTTWRAVAAVLALAAVHGLLAVLPGATLAPSMNLVLFATNLYVLYCAQAATADRSGRAVAAFALGYFVLFALLVIILDRKPLFILLVILYASVFRSTFLLGLFGLFVASFVVFQPYAFETLLPLGFLYVVLWRVRGASRFLWGCLAVGGLGLFAILFPLLHLGLEESVQTLWLTAKRPDVQEALALSVASSSLATLVVTLWGVPLAYALARLDFAGKRTIEALIDVPILVPQSVAGIALLVLLGPGSPLGEALDRGLGVQVAGRFVGLVLAQVFVAAPFLIKTAVTAFGAVPLQLEIASRTLGAGAATTFFRIALPLAGRGLFVGMALAWARAVSEFGAVMLFAPSPVSAPMLVHNEFVRAGASESRPIALLLLLVCLWIFVLLQLGESMLPFARRRPRPTA